MSTIVMSVLRRPEMCNMQISLALVSLKPREFKLHTTHTYKFTELHFNIPRRNVGAHLERMLVFSSMLKSTVCISGGARGERA